MKELIDIAKNYPSFNMTVRAGDLMEMVKYIFLETKKEYETKQESEQYINRNATAERLDVTLSTLWRYTKTGFLNPVRVGGKVMYKQSDIDRILKKGERA